MIPGIQSRAVGRVLVARAHGEFVTIEFAKRYRTRRKQFADNRGIKRTDIVLKHIAAGSAAPALRDEDILMCDGNACQGPGMARGQQCIGLACLSKRQVGINMHKRIEHLVLFDCAQGLLGKLGGADLFFSKGQAQSREAGVMLQGSRHINQSPWEPGTVRHGHLGHLP